MLRHILEHRWVCWVQGGMTFLLGIALLTFGHLMSDVLISTFIVATVLLCSGFVLLAASLMDLAVAVDVTAHQHSLRPALIWWIPGGIGLLVSLILLLAPHLTVSLLAVMAAVHSISIAGLDLLIVHSLRRHAFLYHLSMFSSIGFAAFAALLLIGSLGSDVLATNALGFYAIYFGARFLYLGWESSILRPLDLTAGSR